MANLHLYDGPYENAAMLARRAWREVAAECLQDKLDREFLTTHMSQDEYDERCNDLASFVAHDYKILPSDILAQLSDAMQ